MIYQDYLDLQELQRYASAMNSRAKSVRAVGRLTPEALRDRIFESGGRCEWCGVDLVNQVFELDHILSLGQQGRNTADNIVVACPECNRKKSDKHPAKYAAEIYNVTRKKTSLIETILKRYDVEVSAQLSLFDSDSSDTISTIDSDDTSAIPPYTW